MRSHFLFSSSGFFVALALTPALLVRTCPIGDDGEGEDGGSGAGEEGDGKGEGEGDQSGWIFLTSRLPKGWIQGD